MVYEWARQSVHLVVGTLFALLAAVVSQSTFIIIVASILVAGFLFSKTSLQVVSRVEKVLDRNEGGRGAYLMLFGILLTALLFPDQLVYALLVLGIADSLATLIGYYLGRHTIKYNPSSTYEGSFAFFISASAILWSFGIVGILSAAIVTLVESIDYDSLTYIDDNIMVPLSTGLVLFIISIL